MIQYSDIANVLAAATERTQSHGAFHPKGTMRAHRKSFQQIGFFAFPMAAIDAIDNDPEWDSCDGNTGPLSPGGVPCELSARYRNSRLSSGETCKR